MRRQWQRRRGQPVSVDRRRPVIGVHQHLVVVVGSEGIAVEPLPDGHGLPRNTDDVDAMKVSQQRRWSWIHMHPTVVVIIGVHHDNVLAFVDECRYLQNADKLNVGDDYPRTGQRQQCGVSRLGAWGGAKALGWRDPWRWCHLDAPQPVCRPGLWGQPWFLSKMSHEIQFEHFTE